MESCHNKNNIPYLYLYLYSKLKERSWNSPYLSNNEVLKAIRSIFRIPRTFYYPILFEMENYGLIKKIYRIKYEILPRPNNNLNLPGNELKKVIARINRTKKARVTDESLFKVLPSDCIKKLNKLNCWIMS